MPPSASSCTSEPVLLGIASSVGPVLRVYFVGVFLWLIALFYAFLKLLPHLFPDL